MSTESMVAADETLAQTELEGSSPSITDGFETNVDYSEPRSSQNQYDAIEVESYEDKKN
jgi:hypothetical protein